MTGESWTSVVVAAGAAAVVGAVALAGLLWLSRQSMLWALRLAPLVPVASIAAGVAAASWKMLLDPAQIQVIALVLAVSIPIAGAFGVVAGRRVSDLQRQAAEQAAARERDKAVEERRREVIAWLSHDLRTPLARMRALTEALEDGLEPPDYPTRMSREVDGLAVIVDDIATLSRLHSPTGRIHSDIVDLSDLVSDAVADNQPLAHRRGVTLEATAPGTLLVSLDATEMSRAINNLIVNALRHTRPDGFVRVSVAGRDAQVDVTVQDQCGGIPDEQQARLFEAGWRGTNARTPGDAGAGLGLTIAQRIVQAHGGSIDVANTGDGCAFTVHLPRPIGARLVGQSRGMP